MLFCPNCGCSAEEAVPEDVLSDVIYEGLLGFTFECNCCSEVLEAQFSLSVDNNVPKVEVTRLVIGDPTEL